MHYDRTTGQDRSSPASAATIHSLPRARPRPRQPWGRLLKAVLDLAGDHAVLVRHVERDWASATFSGSSHAITLCFTGAAAEAGERFIIALPDHAFTIPRYLIADAQIVAVDDRQLPERKLVVEVQLLLLEQA